MAQDTPVRPLSRDLILGSWRMTSWVTRDVATGERQDALGQNPRGTVVYTPQRVTFLITKNNRARPEQLPPSDKEKIALFDTMFAYSGVLCVKFCKGGHGWLESCGLAELSFLMLLEVVHVEIAVGFEPVLVGLDG